jgi:hypothetical protein
VAITTNGGAIFNYYNLSGAGGANGFVSSVAFNNDKLNGLAGTDATSDTIPRTTNGGVNWFSQYIPCTISGFCCIKWVPGSNYAFAIISSATAAQCFKTTNNGANWTALSFPSGASDITHHNLFIPANKDAPEEAFVFATNTAGNIFELSDNSLPVCLMSFTFNISGRDINLKWITSQEINNYGFEIYRCEIKSDNTGEWVNTGFVKGHGTSNTPNIYDFTDKNINTGKFKYRLKQIDLNGNYEYFELSNEVVISSPGKYVLSQNYPNPFNPVTVIRFNIPNPENGFVTLKVYDITGKEIKTLVNEPLAPGYHEVTFDASAFSSGIYFYKLETEGFASIKKMMLVK